MTEQKPRRHVWTRRKWAGGGRREPRGVVARADRAGAEGGWVVGPDEGARRAAGVKELARGGQRDVPFGQEAGDG